MLKINNVQYNEFFFKGVHFHTQVIYKHECIIWFLFSFILSGWFFLSIELLYGNEIISETLFWMWSIIDISYGCHNLPLYTTTKMSFFMGIKTWWFCRIASPLCFDTVWGRVILDRLAHQKHQQSQQVYGKWRRDCLQPALFPHGYSQLPSSETAWV